MEKSYSICHSCGKKVEYTACSNSHREILLEHARCEILKGWLTVSHWKGFHCIDSYDFCSFICLQKWVDSQVPKVPEEFLEAFEEIFSEAFEEGKDKNNG